MMITTENYEIYYLDYLDGNLSKKLSDELQSFLLKHPDLVLDDSECRILDEKITFEHKEDLKVWNENETIALNNVERFAIASHEQLLTPKKQKELSQFIDKNLQVKKELSYYENTYLKANLNEAFTNKKILKQKESIALWPWIGIAASLILLISITLNLNTTSVKYSQIQPLDLNISDYEDQPEEDWKYVQATQKKIQLTENKKANAKKVKTENSKALHSYTSIKVEQLPIRLSQEKRVLPSTLIQSKPIKIITTPESVTNTVELNRMNNPIWAVTNLVGAVANKEVDFRTAKATEERAGGFRLKFGDFEIYKTNSKKM